MKDLIERQEAIDAIGKTADELYKNIKKGATFPQRQWFDGMAHAQSILENLPSAQPEIIHCRECKYWMPYDWMFSEVWKSKNMEDYPENEIGCMYADMSMSATDFCSRAERREVSE